MANVKKIRGPRPNPNFETLNNWLNDMVSHHVFRAIVVVIREDIIFDVHGGGECKLEEDVHFEKFLDMACHRKSPVHLIIVPSPCYDDM